MPRRKTRLGRNARLGLCKPVTTTSTGKDAEEQCTTTTTKDKDVKHDKKKFKSNDKLLVDSDLGKIKTPDYKLQRELACWRDSFTVADARAKRGGVFTVAELAAGGCLSALSSVRCGFRHIWTTEIDAHKAQLAEELTRAPCLGDTFAHDYTQVRAQYGHCSLLKSGQPCVDWSSSGPKTGRGENTHTGWMYNAQAQCILDLEPDTLCLEQVAHIMNVDKSAVTELITQLEAKYVMYSSIINCWVYGDPCNRERLIIVGIHRKFGALAESYSIPRGEYHSGRAPQAWMVADKDSDVPPCMWRKDKIYNTTWRDPVPGRLHLIGTTGRHGMGFSDFPNAVYSWQSLFNCQTSYNGGGRRPTLDWQPGEEITRTRMTTMPETLKIASLPADYETFARSIRDDDDFLRDLINLGWPLRFANAMDTSIMNFLEKAYGTTKLGAHRPQGSRPITFLSGSVSFEITPKSILVDSGAQISCVRESAVSMMTNPKRSTISITSANKRTTDCKWEGTVDVHAVNSRKMNLIAICRFLMDVSANI